jgi:hypothetical protein
MVEQNAIIEAKKIWDDHNEEGFMPPWAIAILAKNDP